MTAMRRLPWLVARIPATTRTKLVTAFLVIVGLLVSVGLVGMQALRANNRRAEEVMALQRQIAAYQQIRLDGASQLQRITSALASPNEQTLDAALRQLDQFGYDFDRLQFLTEGDPERLERIQATSRKIVQIVHAVVDLIHNDQLAASLALQQRELVPEVERLERDMRSLVNQAEADMVDYNAASHEAYVASQITIIAFAVGSMFLALTLGYAFSGAVAGPVLVMAERVRQIAAGDFSEHVQLPNRDEMGELAVGLNKMSDDLARLNRDRERHIQFLRQVFGRYLSEDVVTRLLDSPEGLQLGGEKRRVTLLMSDLRGFSSLSDRLPPEQVVSLLNRYLGAMADIILEHQGTINEFIGDAIFVIFGAPEQRDDDAARAVTCAVAMQLAMDSVNAENRRIGLPEIEMGIGIHTGEVVVGNIGSDKRAKYGVVGTHVNITARIESSTVGAQVLISEATLRDAGDLVTVGAQTLISAKGIDAPLTVYDVRSVAGETPMVLSHTHKPLLALPAAFPIRYAILASKTEEEALRDGRLVKVSVDSAEIELEVAVPLLTDLRVLLDPGSDAPSTVYAKVLDATLLDPATFLIRFTSVSPEASRILERLAAS